ncbi:MAG TPA: zf-HC2 domain-containing protein [Thermoanaerobaculia bacterium]|jgi:hypothetical protein|nr:zf-HC2 domain-containing protein [Thermoanaerobaculia bacterium]
MSDELRDAMAESGLGAHPDPERLAAYPAGELSPEEEGRVQDHLALCRECAALLLDLDGLADPGFGAGADLSGKEAVWQRLREEIGREEAPSAPPPVLPFRRPVRSSPRRLQALAASLLVAVLGLSFWVASLQQRVAELSGARTAAVLPLDAETTRGEGSPASSLQTASSDADVITLILNGAGQRRYERYRFEIVRAGGGRVTSGPIEWDPDSYDDFKPIALARREIGPGDYRVRLYGRSGGREEPIQEYAFRVR